MTENNENFTQRECTEIIVEKTPEAGIVSNLGASSKILASVDDREKNFYLRGAMGSTTSTAFGLALSVDDPVVVIEGDGSLLMNLGCLTTISKHNPSNFTIVVMDNDQFVTTGGQSTQKSKISFKDISDACGIESFYAENPLVFEEVFEEAAEYAGTALVVAKVQTDAPGTKPAELDFSHSFLKYRFREAMKSR